MSLMREIRRQILHGLKADIETIYDELIDEVYFKQPPFANSFWSAIGDQIQQLEYDVSAFVHVDEDIRTSQFVESCGSAALTVALRHLHPGRLLGQQSKAKTQPIADFDFTFEKTKTSNSDLTLSDLGTPLGVPQFLAARATSSGIN